MNTLILIKDKGDKWSPEEWFCSKGAERLTGGQITLEFEKSWISIMKSQEILSEYDQEQMNSIIRKIDSPEIYLIEWKGNELLQTLINSLPNEFNILVDNDHGLICDIKLIKNQAVTDWLNLKGPVTKGVST